ncbi:MAG: beta-glucosidase [Planctomycetales bacterium]|nr:beta-glucosidase [Planctomycetales bacterium]
MSKQDAPADAATVDGFPPDFVWGAATSAYQIEGSPTADGAGLSIWDAFARTPGNIGDGTSGDVACDHYRRWREDVTLLKSLGVGAYRFSTAWTRVLPDGTGAVNDAGVAFYDRLVDELLATGITPYVTLYHWDLPLALDMRGGWLNPDSANWFADYVAVMVDRLGDRVRHWFTLNEPWVVSDLGHLRGAMAPGRRDLHGTRSAANNLIRAHGAALAVLRAAGDHQVGLAVNLTPQHAATDSSADQTAARLAHSYINRQFLDPIFLGRHPDDMPTVYGDAWQSLSDAELEAASQPIDLLGVNYYLRDVVRHAPDGPALPFRGGPLPGRPTTAMGWEIYPDGLREILHWLRDSYGNVPLMITENGAAFDDPPPVQGSVPDARRIAYLHDHLSVSRQAIDEGVNLRGYFVWSLLDNFEWQFGYAKRFGLVGVDFETGDRRIKASGQWYRRQIAGAGLPAAATVNGDLAIAEQEQV